MGGLSLWLVPPEGSDIEKKLQTLINEVMPNYFDGKCPSFRPHITITSEIPPTSDPKTVISSISITSKPHVIFNNLRIGTAFWTRGALRVEKTPSFLELAVECRAKLVLDGDYDKAKEWSLKETTPAESGEQGLIPHLSLVYSDVVVDDEKKKGMEEDIRKAGVKMKGDGSSGEGIAGWEGGKLLLVPTHFPMEKWHFILAEKEL